MTARRSTTAMSIQLPSMSEPIRMSMADMNCSSTLDAVTPLTRVIERAAQNRAVGGWPRALPWPDPGLLRSGFHLDSWDALSAKAPARCPA